MNTPFVERDDPAKTIVLRDNAPQWVRDWVQEAHFGELPNNWRYAKCADIWAAIQNDPEYDVWQTSDDLVDIYFSERFQWLADCTSRAEDVDQLLAEMWGGSKVLSVAEIIGAAQRATIEEMIYLFHVHRGDGVR